MSYADKIIGQIFNVDKTMQASGAHVVIGEAVVAQHAVKVAKEADAEIQRLRTQLAESESKCAKMRELLGELPRLLVQARSYVKAHQTDIAKGIKQRNDLHDRLGAMFDRIDAILESEE